MSKVSSLFQTISHPSEISALIQFIFYKPKNILEIKSENKQKIRCYEFLDQTSRGPLEKDRQLLVEFDVVIDEFLSLRKEFRDIIADITNKMGNGMADYVKDGAHTNG
ncbi:5932_t:CDS:2, partial [Cetraspora pellucida]